MQLSELCEYAGRRGWQLTEKYTDQGCRAARSGVLHSTGSCQTPAADEDPAGVAQKPPEWQLPECLNLHACKMLYSAARKQMFAGRQSVQSPSRDWLV
jgi:hypothetical protein